MTQQSPIFGSCLCGDVSFHHTAPEKLMRCNCSACRRYGTLWAHGSIDDIEVKLKGRLTSFTRPDSNGDIAFNSCQRCGVTTHWSPAGQNSESQVMAVNASLCAPEDIADLQIRNFDGAKTWTFID